MKVCIDPGHDKNTSGKRSFDGILLEYEFNRSVAIRLREHLERHGISCLYSYDLDDEQMVSSLSTRADRANSWKAEVFISLHANAYGTWWNDVTGWEAYVVKKGGLAEKLARAIQQESNPYLGLKNRGIKEADLAVLKLTNMPAVLVEHGFYTNRQEAERLKSQQFRAQCALADAKGILRYGGIKWLDEK